MVISARASKHKVTNINDLQGKYLLLHAYTAIWKGSMVLFCPKIVPTHLHKSTRTPILYATRYPLPDSHYIGPYSIREWECGPHHTTLTSSSSSKVTTIYNIQQWYNTINSIKQTIKTIYGSIYTPSIIVTHYPNYLQKAIWIHPCQTPQMIPRTISSHMRVYALQYAQLLTL